MKNLNSRVHVRTTISKPPATLARVILDIILTAMGLLSAAAIVLVLMCA